MFRVIKKNYCYWRLFASVNIIKVIVMALLFKKSQGFNLDVQFPLVYEDPTEKPHRGTYFGYSVIMYSSQRDNKTSWIQVGAPRANSSFAEHAGINEPGVVYRCSFWPPQPCKPMRLERRGNEISIVESMSYWDLKDGAWIGAAMDVQPYPSGRVVICGPRWRNQIRKDSDKEFFQLGVCYWMPAENEDSIESRITKDDAEKLLPLLDEVRIRYSDPAWERQWVYDFGVGEAGMSVHLPLTKKISQLLLGAPGILNWRGGSVLYRDGFSFSGASISKRSIGIGAYSQLILPPIANTLKFGEFEYLGYQVSSGNFFGHNDLRYVASAPRGANLKGKILMFTLKGVQHGTRNSGQVLSPLNRAVGIQFGEYFGASIAVGDLNGDGFDDIIVGSPLYTTGSAIGHDEGRISVFLGSNIKRLIESNRISGKVPGARFGSAIACLGDLNADGYAEVAIGAPYENDGRGAVYIFPGDKVYGISSWAIQHLIARDIHPFLRGFGSSISIHPADIDKNGCPDVTIGAYKSGHAVVFRGRPVIKWEVLSLHSLQSNVPRNATVATLEDVCVTYIGDHAPITIGVWRTIELDPKFKRCNWKNDSKISEMIHLRKGKMYCENQEIMLKPNIKNFMSPIEVNIWYQLPEEKELEDMYAEKGDLKSNFKTQPILIKKDIIEGSDHFCKDCPISTGISKSSILIPFEVECGTDNICHADLRVTGTLPQIDKRPIKARAENISFVIGSAEILQLRLVVSNNEAAELAYITHLYIELGSPARISSIHAACQEISQPPFLRNNVESGKFSGKSSENLSNIFNLPNGLDISSSNFLNKFGAALYVSCDLDNPLHPNTSREILVGVDMSNARGRKGMHLRAWVTSSSIEKNPIDNVWQIYLPFHSEADIGIDGMTEDEILTYDREKEEETNGKMNFNHIYEIDKHGYSPVERVDIEFQIPSAILHKNGGRPLTFLSLKKIEGKHDEEPLKCKYKGRKTPEISNLEHKYNFSRTKKRLRKRDISILNRKLALNNTAIRGVYELQNNLTLYLTCSPFLRSKEYDVECIIISCNAGPFSSSLVAAQTFLHMELNMKALYPLMDTHKAIFIATTGIATIKEPANITQPDFEKPNQALVATVVVEDSTTTNVTSWVLSLSVATGTLLLLLISTGLAKGGFFERQKKDKLKECKKELLLEVPSTDPEDS